MPSSSKRCGKCGDEQPLSAFYTDKKRGKLVSPCKKCRRQAPSAHDWRKRNPEQSRVQTRISKLRSKYGLTVEALQCLHDVQNGRCAICRKPISLQTTAKAQKPHVDHDHKTGRVRGLLCLTCNTGLGMFSDSLDLLAAAKTYLLQHLDVPSSTP